MQQQNREALSHELLEQLTKQLEERTKQLHEAQSRLAALEREAPERRMAGGFAHEMRNALVSAKLYMQPVYSVDSEGRATCICNDTADALKDLLLIARQFVPETEVPRMMDLIRRIAGNEKQVATVFGGVHGAIARALKVTHHIMEYARTGQQRPGHTRVKLHDLVKSLLEELANDFTANRISVSLDIDPGSVVVGDETHFRSILMNIVMNARDALVDTTDERERLIQIKLADDGRDKLILQIIDNGVGIAEEHLPKIFDAFFSTKPRGGTGLGLGMVQELVSLYNGELDIRGELDRGTVVTLGFPRPARSDID